MGTSVVGIFYEEDFPGRRQAGLRTREIGGSSRHGQKSLLRLGREKPGVGQVSPFLPPSFPLSLSHSSGLRLGVVCRAERKIKRKRKEQDHWARDRL